MKKKLQTELVKLCHDIMNMEAEGSLETLQHRAQKLYESLTLLKFIEEHFGELPMANGKSEVAERFENLANGVLQGNTEVPETNPHIDETDLKTPVTDTIRDLVEEMPSEESLDDILRDVMPQPDFVKRDSELFGSPGIAPGGTLAERSKQLHAQLRHSLQIGLNDRIAFIKNLFDGSADDYNRVVSQINTIESNEKAIEFIQFMIKPDYDNWKGKEIYEKRFLDYISARFR